MADLEALTATLEKEKAALVAEKAKSKSNLSKVVLLSKEKKALEAELEAARVLAKETAALSEEQESKLRAALAAVAEAEEKMSALRIEVEAAQQAARSAGVLPDTDLLLPAPDEAAQGSAVVEAMVALQAEVVAAKAEATEARAAAAEAVETAAVAAAEAEAREAAFSSNLETALAAAQGLAAAAAMSADEKVAALRAEAEAAMAQHVEFAKAETATARAETATAGLALAAAEQAKAEAQARAEEAEARAEEAVADGGRAELVKAATAAAALQAEVEEAKAEVAHLRLHGGGEAHRYMERLEVRNEQLIAEKERLLYDVQRLDNDDDRSAIRRGLQAGHAPAESPPPSLPPGAPSSTAGSSTPDIEQAAYHLLHLLTEAGGRASVQPQEEGAVPARSALEIFDTQEQQQQEEEQQQQQRRRQQEEQQQERLQQERQQEQAVAANAHGKNETRAPAGESGTAAVEQAKPLPAAGGFESPGEVDEDKHDGPGWKCASPPSPGWAKLRVMVSDRESMQLAVHADAQARHAAQRLLALSCRARPPRL